MNIDDILQKQREYFSNGNTLPVSFRINMLKKLYACVKKYQTGIWIGEYDSSNESEPDSSLTGLYI